MKTFNRTLATLSIAALSACAHSSKADSPAPEATREAQGRIITFESDANGFNTKTFFYDNGTEVVAFDAQFTEGLAKAAIAALRKETANPIKYLVVTHPNPDKFNGLKVFQAEGAKVVMSDRTAKALTEVNDYKKYYFVKIAKMFTEATYPKLGQPDQVFTDKTVLNLSNGDRVELTELGTAGVSTNQTVASIPAINKLFVGDLVHHKAHAWLEGGIVNGQPKPTLKSWITTLEGLKAKFAGTQPEVLGGRGVAAPLNEAVNEQVKYLKRADKIVSAYVKQAPKAELKDPVESQAHYQALTKDFERSFSDYQLSYMIQYGVYGLVNSKL